jgi:two-component system, chemotaxis family, chemotaxis protein CheY
MKSGHDFPSLNTKRPDGIRPSGRPYKVMVVEDKEFQRKQIAQYLESEGYAVIALAANGEEALKLYDKYSRDLDLITTDLDMPVLDGYALLYELQQRKVKAKIVFVSDVTTKNIIADLLSMGAADFVLKPVDRGPFLERVRQVLSKTPAASN